MCQNARQEGKNWSKATARNTKWQLRSSYATEASVILVRSLHGTNGYLHPTRRSGVDDSAPSQLRDPRGGVSVGFDTRCHRAEGRARDESSSADKIVRCAPSTASVEPVLPTLLRNGCVTIALLGFVLRRYYSTISGHSDLCSDGAGASTNSDLRALHFSCLS